MPTEKKHLYLAHQVDFPSGEKPEKPGDPIPLKRVGPGMLSELDISDKEIAKIPRGSLRAATVDEVEAADQRAKAATARELLAQQEQERQDAETQRQNERRLAERKIEETKQETLAKIDDAQAKERAKENEQNAAELNKAAGIKSAGKK